jgi:hypothetical protein
MKSADWVPATRRRPPDYRAIRSVAGPHDGEHRLGIFGADLSLVAGERWQLADDVIDATDELRILSRAVSRTQGS